MKRRHAGSAARVETAVSVVMSGRLCEVEKLERNRSLPALDDDFYTRERLTEEWQALVLRAEDAGVPTTAIVETMVEVAVEHYGAGYGHDVAANFLRELLARIEDTPQTPAEVAQHLIVGDDDEAELLHG